MVGSVRNDSSSFIASAGPARQKPTAATGFPVTADTKKLEILPHMVTKLPQSVIDEMRRQEKLGEEMRNFTGIADNDVSKIWGNIEVNGRVVAQIYVGGGVASENKYALPDPDIQDPAGRAASILKAYGGKLVLRKDIKNPVQFFG